VGQPTRIWCLPLPGRPPRTPPGVSPGDCSGPSGRPIIRGVVTERRAAWLQRSQEIGADTDTALWVLSGWKRAQRCPR